MKREAVERWFVAAARAVGRAEVADEGRRRVRVAAGAGPVDAAWPQRAAPDRDLLVDLLGRVVHLGEQREVGRRGHVVPGLVELRHPEAVQVRLVADDDVAQLRYVAHDRADVRGELSPRLRRQRGGCRAWLEDAEEDPYPIGSGRDVAQRGELLGRRLGEPRLPVAGRADSFEAGFTQLLQRRARVADSIVDRAHDEAVAL